MYFLLNTAVAAASLFTGALAFKPKDFTFYQFKASQPLDTTGPCDIVPGPDGAIWTSNQLSASIGRIDQITGKVSKYHIPYKNKPLGVAIPNVRGKTPLACAIQPGEDGYLYVSAGDRDELARIDPKTKKVEVFPQDGLLGNLQPFNDLYRDKEGMWVTASTANTVSLFSYKEKKFVKTHKIPTELSLPLGCFVDSDEFIWVAEFAPQASKMARFNKTSETWHEFQCPLPDLLTPAVIRVQEGRYLYFTAAAGNSVGRIDRFTGAMKAYESTVPLSLPGTDIKDSEGNVWSSSLNQAVLGRLLKNGTWVAVDLPATIPKSKGFVIPTTTISVTYDPLTNSIFYTTDISDIVGRIQLHPAKHPTHL